MDKKMTHREIERQFDGESDRSAPVENSAHAAYLRKVRDGVAEVKDTPEIADEQFSAFMAGIHQGIDQPRKAGHGRVWALASIAAASLIVALSTFAIFSGGPGEVSARTVVEDYSTDLEGATVDVETSDDGATVWIQVTTEDLM
jgi:hypothetical protein